MDSTGFIALLGILVVWGASLYAERIEGRSSMRAVRYARYGLFAVGTIVFFTLAYFSREQFLLWQAGEITKYFLPPYRSMGYFFGYVGRYVWAPYALSVSAAIIAYVIARWANRRRGGVFFETEELYFLAAGIFLTGHPGWVAYLIIVCALYVMISLVYFAFFRTQACLSGRQERISFYRLWLPCAVITIALKALFMRYDWYVNLFF